MEKADRGESGRVGFPATADWHSEIARNFCGEITRRIAMVNDQTINTAVLVARRAVVGPWVTGYGPTGKGHMRRTRVPRIRHMAKAPKVSLRFLTVCEYVTSGTFGHGRNARRKLRKLHRPTM